MNVGPNIQAHLVKAVLSTTLSSSTFALVCKPDRPFKSGIFLNQDAIPHRVDGRKKELKKNWRVQERERDTETSAASEPGSKRGKRIGPGIKAASSRGTSFKSPCL